MIARIARILLVALLVSQGEIRGQDLSMPESGALQTFKELIRPEDKFEFFFDTPNRYEEQSAYDWLDAVTADLHTATRQGDSTAIRAYQLLQAHLYFDLGDYNKSVALANDIYLDIPDSDRESMRTLLELIDKNYGQLQLYDKQIEIRKEKRERGFTQNIAFYDIYSSLGMHRKALKDYIFEMKKNIDNTNLYQLAEYDNTVGGFLLKDNTAAAALSYFKKAQGYIVVYMNDIQNVKTDKEVAQAELLKAIIEGNIGKSNVQLTQYREALPHLENSIAVLEDQHREMYRPEIAENTLALAEAHMELGNLEKAREYLEMDLSGIPVELVLQRNRLLAYYYDRIEDYGSEVRYLRRNARLQDSIDRAESSRRKQQLLAIVANEELENSKIMVNEQRQELEKGRAELQAQDMRINLVFISLVFTLLGFAGLVYAYLKSIKNQRLIAEQKHIIENSLVEKDSLLKEIHHRVKNNLQMVSSLLSLQTKNTRSRAAIEALEEGKTRVKAMALIHQKLYQNDDLSVIEMQGYIESLINSVQSVFKKGGHNINISIDAEGVELDIDRAIPFGLILNELVSNSFKYAFPDNDMDGKIYIHIRKTGDGGFFEYTDNGVGLSEDSEERANNSMGIRLIQRLVNQLQSTLNIDKTGEGVRFWFNF
ncbi:MULTISPECIES: sensor histidine kinase [unclassified Robiginitalea]|uniref:sensor histidine kinase n=1 Tax=Robiginitalea TaxID=252306 RepID=UPI002349EC4B|nr:MULTISPECIES: histidine kinase dimerization/phosphoacceptor domain -containing protein [unclassified Robiginitalea]MDC6354212.1 histidine kinase dimerization/phosphoacceptor domain -containing protein [Robiginitalea sp. PM2]MDC6374479.1 histidine kinase dimerization/phosphoacceptor domain -containing protein [Robiginitalea sp. SP8]